MQFNTGNPNIVARARFHAGESSAASGSLFVTQEVKDSINVAYEWLWNQAKKANEGWGVATDYIDSVADQVYYTLPTDFEGQIKTVEIETTGVNLSTATGSPTLLKPTTHDSHLVDWRIGGQTTVSRCFFEWSQTDGKRIGIVAPPSTGGTKSIRVVFEEDLTHLSADSDIPLIQVTHHELIALKAAISLKNANEMDATNLYAEYGERLGDFMDSVERPINDADFQMSSAGKVTQSFNTRTGTLVRI